MDSGLIEIGIGAIGSLVAAALLRLGTGVLDFVPRRMNDLSIGTSFGPFHARGPGDNYDNVLSIRIRNNGSSSLFIVRCVYFLGSAQRVPIYVDARPSQKYRRGYEVKFGSQWKDQNTFLAAKEEAASYVPLGARADPSDFPQGKRGKLWIEYVYDGKTGIHRAKL